ncbi:hypothetical protein ACA910_011391 [Epithemia clementina (nom. ined.)]
MTEDEISTSSATKTHDGPTDQTSEQFGQAESETSVVQKLRQLEVAFVAHVRQQQAISGDPSVQPSPNKLRALEDQVHKLDANVENTPWNSHQSYVTTQQAQALVLGELKKVEPILQDAHSFFKQGGLDSVRNQIIKLTRLVHPLTQQERQEWGAGDV